MSSRENLFSFLSIVKHLREISRKANYSATLFTFLKYNLIAIMTAGMTIMRRVTVTAMAIVSVIDNSFSSK